VKINTSPVLLSGKHGSNIAQHYNLSSSSQRQK